MNKVTKTGETNDWCVKVTRYIISGKKSILLFFSRFPLVAIGDFIVKISAMAEAEYQAGKYSTKT